MYRIRKPLMLGLALVVLVTSCAPAATPTPTPRPTPVPEKPTEAPTTPPEPTGFQLNDRIKQRVEAGEKLVFRLSYVDPALEFAQEIIRGIADASRDFGVDAKLVGPTPIDTAKQLAEIETLVEQGIDGLGVTSIDDAIFVPVMDRIIDQGIPVVTFNVDSPTSKRLAYFGQDNYLGAVAAGEEMIKYLGDNPTGKLAILSHDPSFSSLQDRARGLQDVYTEYPGLEILGVFGNCGSDADLCYSVIENLVTQHPDIKVLHAVDGLMTPTLARFMEKEGLKDQVLAAGWDLVPDALQGVKRGDLKFTEGQYPYRFGYYAVEALYKAAQGEAIESRDVGAEIVDGTNIDNYWEPETLPPPAPAIGFQLNDRIKNRVAAGEKLVFRLSYVDPALEFAQEIIRGINDAVEDFGVDARLVGPTPIDTAKQLAEIETLVEQGIDGLGVTSIDDAIFVPVMDRIIDQGIPVVTFNVDSPTSKRLGYYGQDNYLGAVAAGEEMIKYLGDNPTGKLAILSHDPSFSSLQDRARGLQDVYTKYPGLEILGVFGNCGSDADLCYSVIENLVTQHPDIKVLHAVDGLMTPTLARFMEKEGLKDQVFAAGWDLVPDALQGIKRGDLLFTEGQYPYRFGYYAVEALYKACQGGPVDSRDVGAEIVDATNIDQYLK